MAYFDAGRPSNKSITPSEQQMVDFYRQQDPSQTASNSVISTQTQRDRECIKVAVRVRPVLPNERSKGEVLYYPQSTSKDSLEVIQVIQFRQLN